MRCFLLILISAAAWGQVGVGIRAGAPLGDAFEAIGNQFREIPHNLVIGPTFELRLPSNIGVTADLLYSKLEYDSPTGRRSAGNWQIPVMIRKKFGSSMAKPFLAGGPSFEKITGLALRNPIEFIKTSTAGLAFGAGVEIQIPLLRVAPEFRYTHRFGESFNLAEAFRSRKNRVMFLVGVTF